MKRNQRVGAVKVFCWIDVAMIVFVLLHFVFIGYR